jgi:hypothetical protein
MRKRVVPRLGAKSSTMTRVGWPGLVLVDGEWVPYYDREEMLGERPPLDPLVDLENPDVCESCQ